jgi:hypothetical protein
MIKSLILFFNFLETVTSALDNNPLGVELDIFREIFRMTKFENIQKASILDQILNENNFWSQNF